MSPCDNILPLEGDKYKGKAHGPEGRSEPHRSVDVIESRRKLTISFTVNNVFRDTEYYLSKMLILTKCLKVLPLIQCGSKSLSSVTSRQGE